MTRIVKKAEIRRHEIVQAARSLFRTQGYDQTTIQDVMDHLGIAKGTVYHYFKSKEDMLEAVIVDIVDEAILHMRDLMHDLQGNAIDRIRMLVDAGRIAGQNDEILENLHQVGNSGMHVRLVAATLIKQAPLFGELIRQGCEEGLFQTEHPLECAEFMLSAIQFLTDSGIYPWSPEDVLRRARAFPRLIEAQLKAPAGSFQFIFIR